MITFRAFVTKENQVLSVKVVLWVLPLPGKHFQSHKQTIYQERYMKSAMISLRINMYISPGILKTVSFNMSLKRKQF